jgi:hypothetical protein
MVTRQTPAALAQVRRQTLVALPKVRIQTPAAPVEVRSLMSQRIHWETPRGRYDEHSIKFSLSMKPKFN